MLFAFARCQVFELYVYRLCIWFKKIIRLAATLAIHFITATRECEFRQDSLRDLHFTGT
jgi:hypothetical protein